MSAAVGTGGVGGAGTGPVPGVTFNERHRQHEVVGLASPKEPVVVAAAGSHTVKVMDSSDVVVAASKCKIMLLDKCSGATVCSKGAICGFEAVHCRDTALLLSNPRANVSSDNCAAFVVQLLLSTLDDESLDDFQLVHCNNAGALAIQVLDDSPVADAAGKPAEELPALRSLAVAHTFAVERPDGTDPRRQCITKLRRRAGVTTPLADSGSSSGGGGGGVAACIEAVTEHFAMFDDSSYMPGGLGRV